MKYNININQLVLSEFKELDLKDCAIFGYCKDMCSSVNPKIDNERYEKHTWINYENLMNDMPLLRIKTRNSITPRISKLENVGLITTLKKMVKGHRRVFVRMTTLSDSVFVESTERVRFHEKRVRETVQDYNTTDNYTKEDYKTDHSSSFEEIWDLYNFKKGKKKALQKFETIIKKEKEPVLLIEKIKQAIPEYLKHLLSESWKQQKQLEFWLNQECWNDEYKIKKTNVSNVIIPENNKYAKYGE